MVGSMKGDLQLKNFSVQFESMEYLQILGGDFASTGARVRENKDE